MKYYAVIDTNVIVSALLKWQSVPGKVLGLAMEGFIVPILNSEIVTEYRTVLSRPKFSLTDDIVSTIIDTLDKVGIYVDEEPIDINLPDPKDRIFYEVVMEARNAKDAYLVTGNIKHFPAKTFIVTPRQMLHIILSDSNTPE